MSTTSNPPSSGSRSGPNGPAKVDYGFAKVMEGSAPLTKVPAVKAVAPKAAVKVPLAKVAGGGGKVAVAMTPEMRAAEDKRKKKRNRVIGVTAGVAVVLLGAWWLWASRTPKPTDSALAIAKFVGTDKFAQLPSSKQQAYLDALEKDRDTWRKLPEADRRAAWENMQEARENKELDKYFKMTPAERQKYLDDQIKREEERRKQWQNRAPTTRPNGGGPGQGGPGGRGRQNGDARQKSRYENRSPDRRAQSAIMRADMAARRVETGVGGGGGGRGGGGGGGGRGGGGGGGGIKK